MNATLTTDSRATVLDALNDFVAQRPGLEFGNYGDVANYRSELRRITRDRHDAETLLNYVRNGSHVYGHMPHPADFLPDAFRSAFMGRLSWDGATLDYCTGQYWPTEYRKAVCAVLATAIERAWRVTTPDMDLARVQACARVLWGRGIANRWFN